MCWDAPSCAIVMNFGMQGDMADIVIHAKFYVNQFRGLGALTPPNLNYSIGIAGCYNNSVSIPDLRRN